MPNLNLTELRSEIDQIDDQIVDLFDRRMEIAKQIGLYKQENNLPVFDQDREDQILNARISEYPNRDQFFQNCVGKLFHMLMDFSREQQRRTINKPSRIGYYGVPGSFSEAAYEKFFCERGQQSIEKDVEGVSFTAFVDLFEALKRGEIRYAVVPIENSVTGILNDVYDLIASYKFYITRETQLKIEQCLLGVKGCDLRGIKEVYSQPQAFSQCSKFLDQFPDWKLIPSKSTSKGASMVNSMKDPTKACIASVHCADLYGLEVIVPKIQDYQNNFTRFVVISTRMEDEESADKISLHFTLRHEPGALDIVLEAFSKCGINLLRIDSRPIKGRAWEYGFFVDFEGNLNDENVIEALKLVNKACLSVTVMGNYRNNCQQFARTR